MGRRHGLQRPLDPHQVGSWVLCSALVAGVYAFYMPFVEVMGVRILLVVLYTVLVVSMTVLNAVTSGIDPSDPGLKGGNEGEFFCGLCQASVARTSKHCRACDRCVEDFDHHCKWLNNCIGKRNYRHFFLLIVGTCSMLLLQLAWGLWLFVRSFTAKSAFQRSVADKYGGSVNYIGWQVALALYMVLLIASIAMIGELLCFHIVLISKGMSTYDYIVAQRDAKLAQPAPEPKAGMNSCCKHAGRVADSNNTKRKVRVGINPCAALKTQKVEGSLREREAAAAAGAGANSATATKAHLTQSPSGALPSPDGGFANSAHGSGGSMGLHKAGMAEKHFQGPSSYQSSPQQQSVQDLIDQAMALQARPGGGIDDSALLNPGRPKTGMAPPVRPTLELTANTHTPLAAGGGVKRSASLLQSPTGSPPGGADGLLPGQQQQQFDAVGVAESRSPAESSRRASEQGPVLPSYPYSAPNSSPPGPSPAAAAGVGSGNGATPSGHHLGSLPPLGPQTLPKLPSLPNRGATPRGSSDTGERGGYGGGSGKPGLPPIGGRASFGSPYDAAAVARQSNGFDAANGLPFPPPAQPPYHDSARSSPLQAAPAAGRHLGSYSAEGGPPVDPSAWPAAGQGAAEVVAAARQLVYSNSGE